MTNVMIGRRLAHYEITAHLGSGGMGDVYQATDTTLGRSVAIKLLPEAFRHDADRAARFEREARLLAALNHANIAAIHACKPLARRALCWRIPCSKSLPRQQESSGPTSGAGLWERR